MLAIDVWGLIGQLRHLFAISKNNIKYTDDYMYSLIVVLIDRSSGILSLKRF